MSAAGTLVLLYHRVARLAEDPHGLAVDPDRFGEHCQILRRHCDVVRLRDADRSVRQVAITFDDGYADNAADARTTLAAAGLPATFFITVGRVGQPGEAWWDRLAHIMLECEPAAGALDVEIAGRRLWADLRSRRARERAHLAVFWRLRPLRLAEIDSALAAISAHLAVRAVDRETHRWMAVDELRALSGSSGVDIGAHTLTHPLLTSLSTEEQRQEIDGSGHSLEILLGSRPTLFSYPHGSHDAFDSVTMNLVREARYTVACTAIGGIARAGGDPLQMPRNVVGNWDAERFEKWLVGWLTTP